MAIEISRSRALAAAICSVLALSAVPRHCRGPECFRSRHRRARRSRGDRAQARGKPAGHADLGDGVHRAGPRRSRHGVHEGSRHVHAEPDLEQRLGGLRQQLRRRVLHSRHRPDRLHAEHRSRRRPVSGRGVHRPLDRRGHGPARSAGSRSAARTAGHAVRPQHDRRCHLDALATPRAGAWRHGRRSRSARTTCVARVSRPTCRCPPRS